MTRRLELVTAAAVARAKRLENKPKATRWKLIGALAAALVAGACDAGAGWSRGEPEGMGTLRQSAACVGVRRRCYAHSVSAASASLCRQQSKSCRPEIQAGEHNRDPYPC